MQRRDEGHRHAAPASVLRATGLTRHVDGRAVLAEVDLTVAEGQVHGLAGDRRATSTLVRILAGLDQPEAGRIEVAGRECAPDDKAQSEQAGVWTVLEQTGLAREPTVEEVLAPQTESSRLVEATLRSRDVAAFLRGLGLGHLEPGRAVGFLSGGDRRLVEVARAAYHQARVIVLDHPETGLGEHEVELLHEVLGRLVARGVALLYVTSRPHDIYDLCDSLTLLVSSGDGGASGLELGRLAARRDDTMASWPAAPVLLRSGSA